MTKDWIIKEQRATWKIARGTQRRFPPKYTVNPFQVIQRTFRYLEMHSERHFGGKVVSVPSSKPTRVFAQLQGLKCYFPENWCCMQFNAWRRWKLFWFLSPSHLIFESKNFRFCFSTKYSLYRCGNLGRKMWKIKLQKIVRKIENQPWKSKISGAVSWKF